MNNYYINKILEYSKNNNISKAMAYMHLVLVNKEDCLQYSDAIEIIYNRKKRLYKNLNKGGTIMLYEIVRQILDISEERKVDVGVASDMLKTEKPEIATEISLAFEQFRKYYTPITLFNKNNMEEQIKTICEYLEKDDYSQIDKYLEQYKDILDN